MPTPSLSPYRQLGAIAYGVLQVFLLDRAVSGALPHAHSLSALQEFIASEECNFAYINSRIVPFEQVESRACYAANTIMELASIVHTYFGLRQLKPTPNPTLKPK